MSGELTRQKVPAPLEGCGNTITFPRELRDAIPDLPTCVGRVLALTAMDGGLIPSRFGSERVRLRLAVEETGKLTGEFAILVDLCPEAARALARTLTQLADGIP